MEILKLVDNFASASLKYFSMQQNISDKEFKAAKELAKKNVLSARGKIYDFHELSDEEQFNSIMKELPTDVFFAKAVLVKQAIELIAKNSNIVENILKERGNFKNFFVILSTNMILVASKMS